MSSNTHDSAKRPLGWVSLLLLGLNGIVGVGIFFAPREVALALPGYTGVLAYLGVGLLLLPTALVFARLGRAFPEDGGPYVYARAAFGPSTAFAVGFASFVSAMFSTATVIVGLVESVRESFGWDTGSVCLSAELILLSVTMLALSRGLRLSAVVWSSITVLKALPLLALPIAAVVLAPAHLNALSTAAPRVGLGTGFMAAALPVLFAMQGFEIVPVPAAQVNRARWAVPLATIASLVLATALYAALHAACVAALHDVASFPSPLAAAARIFAGESFFRVVQAAATVSALGITVGMLAMTPRYLAPLGHADAFGGGLDQLSQRAVPLRAFAVTYALLVVVLCANTAWGSIGNLFALSSLAVMLQYAVTAAALVVLAKWRRAGLRPLDAWPAPLSLAACGLLLASAQRAEFPLVVAIIGCGFLLRAVRARLRGGPTLPIS